MRYNVTYQGRRIRQGNLIGGNPMSPLASHGLLEIAGQVPPGSLIQVYKPFRFLLSRHEAEVICSPCRAGGERFWTTTHGLAWRSSETRFMGENIWQRLRKAVTS